VTIEIADGWHINAADPGLSFLIPTSLAFDLPAGARVSDVRFPDPETRTLKVAGDQPLRLYRGTVPILATIRYAEGAGGAPAPTATLKFQACNDTVCLRPTSLTLPLPLEFSSLSTKGGSRRAGNEVSPRRRAGGCILAGMVFYSSHGSPRNRSHVC